MDQHKKYGSKLEVFHTSAIRELVGRTVLTRWGNLTRGKRIKLKNDQIDINKLVAVISRYNNKTYMIGDIIWDVNPADYKFESRGKEISVAQYMEQVTALNETK